MNQRYSYSGNDDGLLGPPERRLALRQSAILALMLTLPVVLVVVLAAAFPKNRDGVVMTLTLAWGLTTGLATLPWLLVVGLVSELFESNNIASAFATIVSVWVCYLINAMYALTRWTARRLFYVVGTIAALQLVVFAILGLAMASL
jgi:hypothetical protein